MLFRSHDIQGIIKQWKREGERVVSAYVAPRTSYEITPLYLKGRAVYDKWLAKRRKSRATSGEGADISHEELTVPPRETSAVRRLAPPEGFYFDGSEDGSNASVVMKRMGAAHHR